MRKRLLRSLRLLRSHGSAYWRQAKRVHRMQETIYIHGCFEGTCIKMSSKVQIALFENSKHPCNLIQLSLHKQYPSEWLVAELNCLAESAHKYPIKHRHASRHRPYRSVAYLQLQSEGRIARSITLPSAPIRLSRV